jgi:acyl dehydratase
VSSERVSGGQTVLESYEIKRFADFHVGDTAAIARTVTERDIDAFAEISGDANPLHVDAGFAHQTRFGRRVVHGALAASFVSAALTRLGIGHVYVSQQTRFRRPVFPGDTLTATALIVEKLPERDRLRVKTTCTNQDGAVVNEGEAVLQCMPELFTTQEVTRSTGEGHP